MSIDNTTQEGLWIQGSHIPPQNRRAEEPRCSWDVQAGDRQGVGVGVAKEPGALTRASSTVTLPAESPCRDVASPTDVSQWGGTSLRTSSLCWPQELWEGYSQCL